MKLWMRAAAYTAIALTCQAASAEWVKFKFAGRVASSEAMPDGTTVPVGTRVTGSFSYDASEPYYGYLTDGQTWEWGFFAFAKAAYLKFRFGDHFAVEHQTTAWINNNPRGAVGDVMRISSSEAISIDGQKSHRAYLGLTLTSHYTQADWLTSLKLPSEINVSQLNPSTDYTYGYLFGGGRDNPLLVLFSIDKITSEPCPLDNSGHLNCR